ncbi:MAG: hydroxymethylbilane synthase [Acidilobaceae archaeon]
MKIRVATRGSRLSIIQSEIALDAIRSIYPQFEFEIVTIKTRGDIENDKPLYEIRDIGVFEKEVNKAVLEDKADIAIHSLKDIPSSISEELEIVFTPPRGPLSDILIHKSGNPVSPEELPEGSIVGTSSIRRIAQLRFINSNIRVENIRGNIDTRVKKLLSGLYDAIIVAEGGVERLKLGLSYYRLPLIPFTPSPGQGIIAVIARRDSRIASMLRGKSDPITWAMVRAERRFLEVLRLGCKAAIGGVAVRAGSGLEFIASILSPDGSRGFWFKFKGDLSSAEKLGEVAGETVKSYLDRVM